MPTRPDGATLAGFLVMVVLFGGNFVGVRLSNAELAPFWGATLRFLIATTLLLGWVALRGVPWPRGRTLLGSVVYGALNFGALYALMYWGMVEVGAGTASLFLATTPLLTFLIAVAVRLERFRWSALLGAVIVVAGIAVTVQDRVAVGGVSVWRVAAVLAGVAATAAATVVIKSVPRGHPVSVNAVGMAVGTLLLAATAAVAGDPIRWPSDLHTQVAVGYLVLSSVVAFVLLVWVLSRWTASATAYAGVLAPFVATGLGVWFAQEHVTWASLFGGLLVLVGVYFGAIRGARPPPVPMAPGKLESAGPPAGPR